MYVNEKLETLYIHIPKTAGRLINFHLKGKKVNDYEHDSINDLPDKYNEYYKFTTIRNPYAWYISLFTYLQKYSNELSRWVDHLNQFEFFLNNCANPVERVKVHNHIYELEKPTSQLYDFVRKNKTIDCGWFTVHFIYACFSDWKNLLLNSSVEYIKNNFKKLVSIDEIVKIEELDKFERVKIDTEKKINCSNHEDYHNYYNNEQIKMVRKQDSLIFDLFGYKY